MKYLIGVDVGTANVRAGIFGLNGGELKSIAKCDLDIKVYNSQDNFYEQSSNEIWNKCCMVIKNAIKIAQIDPKDVEGIGFDATCSLVVLDKNYNPMSVSLSGESSRNIIMWMDHRAVEEADYINKRQHPLLKYTGGNISVEMQPPKILWLKKNIPNFFANVGLIMDLVDFLTYKATGYTTRSICTVTCKWGGFNPLTKEWDSSFWSESDLVELCANNYSVIGNVIECPGTKIRHFLCSQSAQQMCLPYPNDIRIPIGLIDAYAGLLGSCNLNSITGDQLLTISGSSACHMLVTDKEIFVDGVWGPYKNVVYDGKYILEAGQTANGILLDKVLTFFGHSLRHEDVWRYLLVSINATGSIDPDLSLEDYLSSATTTTNELWSEINKLTSSIHINPDFLGNRSPRADSNIRGSIIGLTLDTSPIQVAKIYLAVLQGIAYGMREIIDQLKSKHLNPHSVLVCGGLINNKLYLKVLSDILEMSIYLQPNVDLVLLGAAKLCLDTFDDLHQLLFIDQSKHEVIQPDTRLYSYHRKKYQIYQSLVKFQEDIQKVKCQILS